MKKQVLLGPDAVFVLLDLNAALKKDAGLPGEDRLMTVVFRRTLAGLRPIPEPKKRPPNR